MFFESMKIKHNVHDEYNKWTKYTWRIFFVLVLFLYILPFNRQYNKYSNNDLSITPQRLTKIATANTHIRQNQPNTEKKNYPWMSVSATDPHDFIFCAHIYLHPLYVHEWNNILLSV